MIIFAHVHNLYFKFRELRDHDGLCVAEKITDDNDAENIGHPLEFEVIALSADVTKV